MARKGILSTDGIPAKRPADKPAPSTPATPTPRGAVGALQSSLAKLQESAVQEIEADLIDDAGYEDRLGLDGAAQDQLRESIETYGQQVPVLLRPHPKRPGRYEIVYGRRRLQALRGLGQPVRAMVRHLDDHALVMAQGQENTSRQDLSFIEKASFAAQLERDGYDRPTIAAALSTDQPMISRMLKIGRAFDIEMLRAIGSAPSVGRERWASLAKLLEDAGARDRAKTFVTQPEFTSGNSDARFDALFKRVANRQPPAPAEMQRIRTATGTELAQAKMSNTGLTIKVSAKAAPGFDRWLATQADAVLQDLHDRWQASLAEEDTRNPKAGGTTDG